MKVTNIRKPSSTKKGETLKKKMGETLKTKKGETQIIKKKESWKDRSGTLPDYLKTKELVEIKHKYPTRSRGTLGLQLRNKKELNTCSNIEVNDGDERHRNLTQV